MSAKSNLFQGGRRIHKLSQTDAGRKHIAKRKAPQHHMRVSHDSITSTEHKGINAFTRSKVQLNSLQKNRITMKVDF